uniref:portal protein n=1 Tax=Alistipes sp. TaxID=1872444 RepID=UPI00405736B2
MLGKLTKKDLRRLVGLKRKDELTVEVKHPNSYEATSNYNELLLSCWNDWVNMEPIREEHRKNQRYKNNKQWDDLVPDPDRKNRLVAEGEKISRSGRTPITNNLIDPIIRNIHGQVLSNPTDPIVVSRSEDDGDLSEMLTNTLQDAMQLNKYGTLRISAMESLLSSGLCVGKVRFGYWYTKNRTDLKLDFISINRFFFNQDAEDPRLDDIYRIGEIHDLTWQQLVRDFNILSSDESIIKEEYASTRRPEFESTAHENLSNLDFYGHHSMGKYRVFEIWRKLNREVVYVHDPVRGEELYDETHAESHYANLNRGRVEQMVALGVPKETIEASMIHYRTIVEEYWEALWLTPQGICLKRMETPYLHQSHPYVIGTMPRIDGISSPILSNVREIQRTANRHYTMIDFALGQAAKGLLLVPQSILGDLSIEDFQAAWTKTNAAIVYDDSNPNSKAPTQISSNPIPAGAFEFLRMELESLKEVSGLSGAMQGQVSRSGTPSSLYAQQAQNSMLNFVLLFDCYKEFNTQVAEKALQVIMQYYTSRRHIKISGKSYSGTAKYYEPEMVKKIIDWNIVIADSTDTPVFRQVADDFLKYLFESQAINVEMLLENSSLPFAQKLLAQIRSARQAAEQGEDWAGQVQQMQTPNNQELGITPQSLAAVQRLYNAAADPTYLRQGS